MRPPTDLLAGKENSETIKVKLPNGTFFTMGIFVQGNPEEYLARIIAVLCLINQKELDTECKRHTKKIDKLTKMLESLCEPTRPSSATLKEDPETHNVEIKHSQEMFKRTKKEHGNLAITQTYELLRNLIAGQCPDPMGLHHW